MKMYKATDRIRVEVEIAGKDEDDRATVAFVLAPLTREQKTEVMGTFKMEGGKVVQSGVEMTMRAIKFALKDIEGVTDTDGKPYKLPLDAAGLVKDQALDDVLNIPVLSAVIVNGAMAMTRGVPTELVGEDGKKLPNVEVILDPK